MADVFVSYARTDKSRVAPLVAAIEAQGWSVWWDPEISPGQEFDRQISAALKTAAAVVVVWTPTSVESRWVRGEARDAADRGVLVPVRFDGAELPIDVRAIHTTDLDGWGEDAQSPQVQELLRALGAIIARKIASQAVSAGTGPAVPTSAVAAPRVAICVLPFSNMSGDAEQEYFSDGISEDVITDLNKVSALAVVARNTAFGFKGKQVDIPLIARQLKVSHILEGSVRKAGQRVRISAQLIDSSTGNHVWAERYDRDLNDIFALQDEISQAIVNALKLKLLPEEKKAIEQRGTDNVEAYNLYLMARQNYATGIEQDPRRAEASVRLCRRATEIDPSYAHAWALMALGQMLLHFAHGRRGDDGMSAAERALALDGNLAEAHAVKARVLSQYGRHDDASTEIEVALRLDPESYEVNKSAAYLRVRQQRLGEAIRFYEKAMTLMETDVNSPSMLLTCYGAVGDMQGVTRSAHVALARAERILAQDPNNGAAMGYGVAALACLGEADRAMAWINRALLIDPDNMNMRYNFACALVVLKRDEAAIEILGPVFDTAHIDRLNHTKVDPDLDPLRGDPRFKAMLGAAEARIAAAGDDGS
ncbi:MAG: TIR domain-containing protein [Steroidobacteraceae bacterium]|nr:TIR domain-containing protein [Pseudomonadota bacterium]MBP7608233.1 TIR domain-containing protein [Steroidobacteraceae bacterium]MBP9129268.1 TIR domain-containing protein [Steroidobacteraceae bacterium]